jgi:hypothetical protein
MGRKPKDWTIYIDRDNQTRACLTFGIYDNSKELEKYLEKEGCKVIGNCSTSEEIDAVKYGDRVLR